jgi:hypothetical protein
MTAEENLNEQVLEKYDQRPLGRTMRCQNCAYWEFPLRQKQQLDDDNAKGPFSDIYAECRRHAPIPLQYVILHIGQLTAQVAVAVNILAGIKMSENDDYELGSDYEDNIHEWPMTNANAWCGEFEQRREDKK